MVFAFISHASDDKTRIAPIIMKLRELGVLCWFDRPQDLHDSYPDFQADGRIELGEAWPDSIHDALEQCGCVVVFWSKNATPNKRVLKEEANKGLLEGKLQQVELDFGALPQLDDIWTTLQAEKLYKATNDALLKSAVKRLAAAIKETIRRSSSRGIHARSSLYPTFASARQILSTTNKTIISTTSIRQKYIKEVYVKRALKSDLSNFFERKSKTYKSSCAVLIAPAGSGKTCLCAHLALNLSETSLTLLLPATLLRKHARLHVFEDAVKGTGAALGLSTADSLLENISRLSSLGNFNLIIDGINEFCDPLWLKRELIDLAYGVKNSGTRILLTCRDYYWGIFKSPEWDFVCDRIGGYTKTHQARRQLADFHYEESATAVEVYSKHFKVSVRPTGDALEQFRHPLLLRFFCEAYAGESVGTIRNIRLKQLFDVYGEKKLRLLSQQLQTQGLRATNEQIMERTVRLLRKLALSMLISRQRTILTDDAKNLEGADLSKDSIDTIYSRLLDEFIIIEELPIHYSTQSYTAFVFEAYMEYMMAGALFCEWSTFSEEKIFDQIASLTERYFEFNQIMGVVLFLSLNS